MQAWNLRHLALRFLIYAEAAAFCLITAGMALGQDAARSSKAGDGFDVSPLEVRVLGQRSWFSGGPASLRVVVTNHNSGQPLLARVNLRLEQVTGTQVKGNAIPLYAGTTNSAGTLDATFKVPGVPVGSYRLTVATKSPAGSDTIEENLQIQRSAEVLFTCDKPIYQPSQTIHMRALGLDMAARIALSNQPVTFEAEDARGNKVFKKHAVLSQHGVASADFELADEVNMGVYTLRAILPTNTVEKKINVSRYVLPRYKATLTFGKPYYLPGETVHATLTANYFFGKPVSGGKAKVVASTPVIGLEQIATLEGVTDAAGKYAFQFKLPDSFVGQPFEQGKGAVLLAATLKDAADHTQEVSASAPVVKDPISVLAVPEHKGIVKGIPNRIYVAVASPDGAPTVNATVDVRVQPLPAPGTLKPVPYRGVKTDALGLAAVDFTPTSDSARVMIDVTDVSGHHAYREIDIAGANVDQNLILRADKSLAKVGEILSLTAMSPSASGTLFLDVIRNKQTILTVAKPFSQGKADARITITPDMAGTLELNAYRILPNEQIVRDTRTVLVTNATDLVIDAALDHKEYKPGGEATIQFTVTDGAKHPVLAALGIAIVDESVFGLSEMHPGLEKVYFNLEKELMTPKYEIHGLRPTFLMEPQSGPITIKNREMAAAVLLASAPVSDAYQVNANSFQTRWMHVQEKLVARMVNACQSISSAADKYRRDTGSILAEGDGLHVLVERGYLTESQLLDPWSTPYKISNVQSGFQYFTIASAGPDRKWGTADDTANVNRYGTMGRFGGQGFGGRMRGGGFAGGGAAAEFGAVRALGGKAMMLEDRFAEPMAAARAMDFNRATALKKDVKLDAAGGSSGAAEPRVRQYFPETMMWRPELITDEQGKARLTVPLADSITTWRVSVLGNTIGSMVGSASLPIKVFQDFFVELDMPLTLTQNDHVEVPVAIYNYLNSSQDVTVKLEPEAWYQLDGSPLRTVHLAAGEVTSVHFPLKVSAIGRHTLTATARGTRLSDAVRRPIEVTPDGKEQLQTINDVLSGTSDRQITVPANAIAGASTLWLKVYPGSFSQLIEGLDGILRMPNGCFEQTSSTTYPNILVLDYLKTTKKVNPEIQMKAEQYINIGYQRLVTFECKNGGFSWFGNEPAHQVLTAYGLLEFSDMAKVHDVDPGVISRTSNWLAGRQSKDGSWNETGQGIAEGIINRQTGSLRTTAYTAWALAESGFAGPQLANGVRYVIDHLDGAKDPYTLAVILNLLAKTDRNGSVTSTVAQKLIALAHTTDKTAFWQTDTATFTGARSIGADLETTGLAAYALVKWGKNSTFTNKVLSYLVQSKDAFGTWQSTQGTVWALKALIYASHGGSGGGKGTLTVTANGKPAAQVNITEDDSELMRQIDLRELIKPGANTIHLDFKGDGSPQYQIVARSYVPWANNPGGAPPFQPLSIAVNYDQRTLAQNDLAGVTVTVHNNTERIAEMPLIDIGIPPGFTVEPELLDDLVKEKKISKYTISGRQLIVYLEKIGPTETIDVRYKIRAKYPIRAKTPLSKVYPYYNPEKASVSAPQLLTVTR